MPKIDVWKCEAVAIDTACMNLMETVRRGRKKQQAYIQEDNDPDGASSLEEGIAGLEQAQLTLRRLLNRAGWIGERIGQAYAEESQCPPTP
jgi:hypothetical protein